MGTTAVSRVCVVTEGQEFTGRGMVCSVTVGLPAILVLIC